MSDLGKSIYSNYENFRDGSSYAVDIRESSSGIRRVFISETIALDRKRESRVISVQEKHLSKLIDLLKSASRNLNEEEVSLDEFVSELKESNSIEAIKSSPQAGQKWTDEEEQWLLSEYLSEPSFKILAELAMRKPGGVRARLKRFGILDCERPKERVEIILGDWGNRDSYYDKDL
jgi:hypothetical protein